MTTHLNLPLPCIDFCAIVAINYCKAARLGGISICLEKLNFPNNSSTLARKVY